MAINRSKRPLVRDHGEVRDATLFIVATEGEKTEKIYFSVFRSSRLKVRLLPTLDGKSSPNSVLERISEFQSAY
jgi:hypothetical protein